MSNHRKKIFKNANVTIERNTVRCEENSARISNISQIWVGKNTKNCLSLVIMFILIAITSISLYLGSPIYIIIVAVGGVSALAYIYFTQTQYYSLNIELCSGGVFSFLSTNINFANETFNILNNIITEKKEDANYTFNYSGEGKVIINLTNSEEESLLQNYDAHPYEEKINESLSTEGAELTENINEGIVEKADIRVENFSYTQLSADLEKLYTYFEEEEERDDILALIELASEQCRTNDKVNMKETFSKFISLELIGVCNQLNLDSLIEKIRESLF